MQNTTGCPDLGMNEGAMFSLSEESVIHSLVGWGLGTRLVFYGNWFSFCLQLQTAIGCGFRNSGIMCGKKGKIMLVRKPWELAPAV